MNRPDDEYELMMAQVLFIGSVLAATVVVGIAGVVRG